MCAAAAAALLRRLAPGWLLQRSKCFVQSYCPLCCGVRAVKATEQGDSRWAQGFWGQPVICGATGMISVVATCCDSRI
jgi:hypothetical protein